LGGIEPVLQAWIDASRRPGWSGGTAGCSEHATNVGPWPGLIMGMATAAIRVTGKHVAGRTSKRTPRPSPRTRRPATGR